MPVVQVHCNLFIAQCVVWLGEANSLHGRQGCSVQCAVWTFTAQCAQCAECSVTLGEPIVYMAGVRALRHRRPKLRPRFAHITLTAAHIITLTGAQTHTVKNWSRAQFVCFGWRGPEWYLNRPGLEWLCYNISFTTLIYRLRLFVVAKTCFESYDVTRYAQIKIIHK